MGSRASLSRIQSAAASASAPDVVRHDDSRLGGGGAPAAHAASHASGGSDPVSPASIGAAPTSHAHAGADISSGTIDAARLPDLSATYIPLSQKGASGGVAALTGTVLPRSYYQYANNSQDGSIVLAGDLGGTATAPTVPGLANKANRSLSVRTVSASGAVLDTDDVILADTTSVSITLTLPTAVGRTGRDFLIKKIGANPLTVATTSSQVIDGLLTEVISMTNGFREVVSDGANWRIRGGKVDPVITSLADVAAGATLAINAAAATVYRARLMGATATLAAATNPIDGDVINVELYATVACVLTVDVAIIRTGGIASTISIGAGKLWSGALRYRAATSPVTSAAAWRLLASSVDV